MELTNEILEKYVEGNMEIQNNSESYYYRGLIKQISIRDNNLCIEFEWLAHSNIIPPIELENVTDQLDYEMFLGLCGVSDIGDDRISILNPYTQEMSVLFPKGGSQLDPGKVKGLVI